MNSTKASKEFAILVINTQEPQGQSADTLLKTLFQKLNKIMRAKIPPVSASIDPEVSCSQQATSCSVRIESPRSTKLLLFKEFFFPLTPYPITKAYLLWISRSAIRAWVYLWYKVPEIWREATSSQKKVLGIIMIAREFGGVVIETLLNLYTISLTTLILIPRLRRVSTVTFVLYFFLTAFIVASLGWKQILIPLIMWISQFTNQLIELVPGSRLTFDILFPVIAGTFFAAIVTIVTVLVRIARWIIKELDSGQEVNLRTMSELSYLFDPLYAAKVKDDFERQLIDLSKAANFQHIFVVCDQVGALLAYEVLSRVCARKITRPVTLLTHHLFLAGLPMTLNRSLWLFVDPIDWARFSKTTPRNLHWWHCNIRWPNRREYTVRLTSRPRYKLPQVKRKLQSNIWFKGTNTILADRLITLMNLS